MITPQRADQGGAIREESRPLALPSVSAKRILRCRFIDRKRADADLGFGTVRQSIRFLEENGTFDIKGWTD